MQTTGDISLYIHIPFCKKKCPYCHFYSIKNTKEIIDQFISSLLLELEKNKDVIKNKNVVSIYFGGGTPSLLETKYFEKILSWINKSFQIAKDCEITIEANPCDISYRKMKELLLIGINRVSIGVQSFDNNLLKVLNRTHTSKQAIDAILHTYDAGINNISIDLMYDIFNQDIKSWENTLKELKSLPLTHISLYNLTIEENTYFGRKKEKFIPLMPKNELSLELLQTALFELKKMQFDRYEISAFAKDNKISIHNVGYWIGRAFLGFGPSAFSYFNNKRYQNICNVNKYINNLQNNASIVAFEETLQYPENIKELFVINLRLKNGVDIKTFEKSFYKLPHETKNEIACLQNQGFIDIKGNIIKLTDKGFLFYDTVAESLI